MKTSALNVGAALVLLLSGDALAQTDAPAEDWKGAPEPAGFHVGALTGLGVLDSDAGFEIIGTFSRKIVATGFVPDINNSVSVELQAGPLFIHGATAFSYSTHLRWDFQKNTEWTFYALGGLAGHITGDALGNRFLLFPRFGIGAMRHFDENAPALRFEASHERLSVGAIWDF